MWETDADGEIVEVESLDSSAVLGLIAAVERRERAEARQKLRLAHHWCVLHPATEETGAATWGQPSLAYAAHDERLGGQGTPAVSAFAPEPFAAALGVSTDSGMQLLADALDLVHRHPELWKRVEALEVPAWKARRIAQATHSLSAETAAYVDSQLAERAAGVGWPTIERTIAHSVARHQPELVEARERRGKHGWGVALHHDRSGGFDATSELRAVGDTFDLTRFYDVVCDEAAALGALGDADPLGARKAKALGVIADRQARLDLLALGVPGAGAAPPTTQGTGRPVARRTTKTQLYLHLAPADLEDLTAAGGVERLGPATVERIREWVGHAQVTVVPVLDRGRNDAVDEHDPPDWMRELVLLRDPRCVFPWCSRDSRRCDLDHVVRYDKDGPPGQTFPEGLAPLCRRHHRCKTHGRWRYRRNGDGTYNWTSPHRQTYLTSPTGTVRLQS